MEVRRAGLTQSCLCSFFPPCWRRQWPFHGVAGDLDTVGALAIAAGCHRSGSRCMVRGGTGAHPAEHLPPDGRSASQRALVGHGDARLHDRLSCRCCRRTDHRVAAWGGGRRICSNGGRGSFSRRALGGVGSAAWICCRSHPLGGGGDRVHVSRCRPIWRRHGEGKAAPFSRYRNLSGSCSPASAADNVPCA